MIELSLTNLVFIYLIIPILIFIISWVVFENRSKRKKPVEDIGYIWYCNICSFTYIDTIHGDYSQCPRCKSFLEKNEAKQ